MYVVIVSIKVKPGSDNIAAWLASVHRNHLATRQEPGNVRFDLLQAAVEDPVADAPVDYILYEVYKTKEDFLAHQRMPHYLAFREEVAELMAEPRKGVHYTSVFPEPWQ